MKKFAILSMSFLFLMSVFQSRARTKEMETKSQRIALRKLEGSNVNDSSKRQFIADFGKLTDVQWKRSADFDETTITQDVQQMTVYSDFDSKLYRVISHKKFSELPVKDHNEIKAKYKDYAIGRVISFDDNEMNKTGMVLVDEQFNDVDSYFVELAREKNSEVI